MNVKGIFVSFFFLSITLSFSQSLPPLFTDTPEAIVPTEVIAEFPVGTFLENIAIDKDGNLFVTSLEEGKVYRVTQSGEVSTLVTIEGQVAGISFDNAGDLIISGQDSQSVPSVFRVSKTGELLGSTTVDGAVFLNGVTPLRGDTFLIADSYRGAIWTFDIGANTYDIWLEDEALARPNPENPFPAVNGLKVFGNTLYATNTQRQTLLRIPILADGAAGEPGVFAENINGDDFALDEDGNLYVTTHVYNSVVRVDAVGDVTVIAEADEGVTGSTALAFRPDAQNARAVFVVTNGGMSLPPPGGVQPAKVVRLEVGE